MEQETGSNPIPGITYFQCSCDKYFGVRNQDLLSEKGHFSCPNNTYGKCSRKFRISYLKKLKDQSGGSTTILIKAEAIKKAS